MFKESELSDLYNNNGDADRIGAIEAALEDVYNGRRGQPAVLGREEAEEEERRGLVDALLGWGSRRGACRRRGCLRGGVRCFTSSRCRPCRRFCARF